MATEINRLTHLLISKALPRGNYPDGGGLYLQVRSPTSKSWVFRYHHLGKCRELGLGSLNFTSLAMARQKRNLLKNQLSEGIDPFAEKKKRQFALAIEETKKISFEACATACIESRKAIWKNEKHSQQWTNTLQTYAFPVLGSLDVQKIDTNLILEVLKPIWNTKTETASRVRNRIEIILNWATARGFREGANPARWKGHLDTLLPPKSQIQSVKHMASLPYRELPSLMFQLRQSNAVAPAALAFLILTGVRTNEVIYAAWDEIDFEKNLWTIPASRMKAKKEHIVPLTRDSLKILRSLHRDGPYVFQVEGRHLSNNALLAVLARRGLSVTVHGFRSTFREWISEETEHSSEVAEQALAHSIRNRVEAAYRRGNLLPKRVRLMEDWNNFCYPRSTEDCI